MREKRRRTNEVLQGKKQTESFCVKRFGSVGMKQREVKKDITGSLVIDGTEKKKT